MNREKRKSLKKREKESEIGRVKKEDRETDQKSDTDKQMEISKERTWVKGETRRIGRGRDEEIE